MSCCGLDYRLHRSISEYMVEGLGVSGLGARREEYPLGDSVLQGFVQWGTVLSLASR